MVIVEHLVLKYESGILGGKFKTRYHDDLGSDLQRALEVLEQEGWEVVTAYSDASGFASVIILKRTPR